MGCFFGSPMEGYQGIGFIVAPVVFRPGGLGRAFFNYEVGVQQHTLIILYTYNHVRLNLATVRANSPGPRLFNSFRASGNTMSPTLLPDPLNLTKGA